MSFYTKTRSEFFLQKSKRENMNRRKNYRRTSSLVGWKTNTIHKYTRTKAVISKELLSIRNYMQSFTYNGAVFFFTSLPLHKAVMADTHVNLAIFSYLLKRHHYWSENKRASWSQKKKKKKSAAISLMGHKSQ